MSVIKRQTIIGTIWSYAGVAIGTISQAFLIPNYFTEAQNGLIQILLSWMLILALFADLGFGNAGTKFFNTFRDHSQNHKGFIFWGFLVVSIGLGLSYIFLSIFKSQIISTLQSESTQLFEEYYFILFPILAATAYFNLLFNYSRGLYDTIMGNFLSQFWQRFLIFIFLMAYILGWVSFYQFMILWTLSIFSQFPLILLHCMQLGNFSFKPNFKTFQNKNFRQKFTKYAAFSILTGLSSIVITKLDTLMVYEYLGLANTGIYSTCLLFGSVMMMSYNVTLRASSAIVVDALTENNIPKIERVFKKSALTQLVLGSGLFILVVCNVDSLFSFIKPSYAAGKNVLIIIGLAKLFDLSFGLNSLILVFSKHYIKDSLLIVSFVLILLGLNHLLIPQYGMDGAAIAALIATLYFNIARNSLIYYYFKIHSFSKRQLSVLLLGLALLILGWYLPIIGETLLLQLASVFYKSIVIGGLFVLGLRLFNISPDISQVIDNTSSKLRIKVW